MIDPYERIEREGSLSAALDSLYQELNDGYDDATRTAYNNFLEWHKKSPIGQGAAKVGDRLPEFLLPDHEGRLTSSAALLSAGPLVLSFFRGGWCPYCGLEMASIEIARPAVEAVGAQIVGVTPEVLDHPANTVRARRLGYRLLADIDNGLALSMGLVFLLPQDVIDTYLRRGVDLALRQGNDGWMLPVPGTFVIDQAGVIRLAFVELDYRVRLAPEKLVEAIKRL